MIQILEENLRPQQQSFMDRLGKGLYQGGQAAGQLIPEYLQQQQQQQQMQDQSTQISELVGFDVSNYSPENQKMILENALKGDLLEKEYGLKSDVERLKGAEKGLESQQFLERTQNIFNDLVGLVKGGNLGVGSGIGSLMGGKTAKDVGKFQSLTGGLEAALVDMVNKGTMSDSRFKYIKEYLLPQPNEPINMIKGKLEGIAEVIGIDPSVLIEEKQTDQLITPKKRAKMSGILP